MFVLFIVNLHLQEATMISKALLVFCLVSAVVCKNLDSVDKIGSTEATISTEATEPTNKPCVISEGENGECVPYYRCQLKEFDEWISIRIPILEPCDDYLDSCCTPEDIIDPKAEGMKGNER